MCRSSKHFYDLQQDPCLPKTEEKRSLMQAIFVYLASIELNLYSTDFDTTKMAAQI